MPIRRRRSRPTTSSCFAPRHLHRHRAPHGGLDASTPTASLRASPTETAIDPAFVALLHGDVDDFRYNGTRDDDSNQNTERPARSTTTPALNGRLSVLAYGGNDTSTPTTRRSRSRSTAAPATTCSRSARSSAPSARRSDRRLLRTTAAALPQDTFPDLDRDHPRLAEPGHRTPRWSCTAAPARTRSPSTPTRPSCASRATTTTTCSSSGRSRSPRPVTRTPPATVCARRGRHAPRPTRPPARSRSTRRRRRSAGDVHEPAGSRATTRTSAWTTTATASATTPTPT